MRLSNALGPLIVVVILLVGSFSGGQGRAYAELESGASVPDDFMSLSGLDHHIQQLPRSYMALIDVILTGIEKQGKVVSRPIKLVVRQSFLAALEPHVLQQEVRRRLDNALSSGLVAQAGDWLRSDLGRKITALEKEASSPEASVQQAAFLLQLKMEAPSAERMRLVRRLAEVNGSGDHAVEVWETITVTLVQVMAAAGGDNPPGGTEAIRQKLSTLRPNMKALFQQAALLEMLFAYRALRDAELNEYAAFLESETGRQTFTIVNSALKEAATSAIKNMEPTLVNSLRKDYRKA